MGREAIDVARLTGVKLRTTFHLAWEPSDIDPAAVTDEIINLVYIPLRNLTWDDRWRVAWARIGAHTLVKSLGVH